MRRICITTNILISAVCMRGYGQTSGPSTPEVQKFTQNSSKQLVDPFSGNMNYNISLFVLDSGYPVNLSYTSGGTMTQEASQVGFGWQLNIGHINRIVRGIPDDFSGETITRKLYQQDELNIGIGVGLDAELFGATVKTGVTDGVTFSNMHGPATVFGLNVSGTPSGDVGLSGGLGLGISNHDGATISPNLGLKYKDFSVGLSTKISSMEGMKYLNLNAAYYSKPKTPGQPGTQTQFIDFPLIGAKQAFTPDIDFPTKTASFSFSYRIGGELWGLSVGGKIFGNYAVQTNPVKEMSPKAYGYLYLQNKPDRSSLMDIGTEKDGPVFAEDKNLPLSYLANDIYSVSAQDISGTFRPFRTNITVGHKTSQQTSDFGGSLGGESHEGAWAHLGIDVTANFSGNYSGEWQNDPLEQALYQEPSFNAPVYFKNVGEANLFKNKKLFDSMGGTGPVSMKIDESVLINQLLLPGGRPATIGALGANAHKVTEPANNTFQYLTAEEATRLHMALSSFSGHGKTRVEQQLPRYDDAQGDRKRYHISSITVTRDDGTRYEFGIAAYNHLQREVRFSIKGKNKDSLFNKLTSVANGDDSPANTDGTMHYFSATETPGYAYAYLLTAVYSADYVDVTGDGPTVDDLGTYTKFNYTREYSDFKWRTPYQDANYINGNLSDKGDDMGSYIYGEKEIWTLNSIETKNSVVEIYSSARADANQVAGPAGGIDASRQLSRIDSVKLFSRADYKGNSPVPTKTVFFTYDYSLCKGLPANKYSYAPAVHPESSGKLTLTRLSFTYGKSLKGKRSYYAFGYHDDPQFRYDESKMDVWGTVRCATQSVGKNAVRFPYSEQNDSLANLAASAWQLNKISLPTGGKINIGYEAKDYAYVQDKKAMQMFRIAGFAHDGNIPGPVLYAGSQSNLYLFVDVGKKIDKTDIYKYLTNDSQIYLNCVLNIGTHDSDSPGIEEVKGYFNIEPNSTTAIPGTTMLRVKLASVSGYNPVSRVLWQKIRKNLTQVIKTPLLNADNDPLANIMSVVGQSSGALADVFAYFNFENKMTNDLHGSLMSTDVESFARLYNPDGNKRGGGSRVKSVTISDNWKGMTGDVGADAVYGQDYVYKVSSASDAVSSGVAAYEPIGNEENPFVTPAGNYSSTEDVLAPELYYFRTEPYGESFFPSPSIGYSRVEIRDRHDILVKKNATGSEVYEFYTSKDFPTLVKRTEKQMHTANPGFGPFGTQGQKLTASQGFSVELNDMNGKLRSHKLFAENNTQTPVSGIEYLYKMVNGSLDNNVQTIDPATGHVSSDWVGADFDFYIQTTESANITKTPRMAFNMDVIPVIFGIPFPVPTFFPSYTENLVQYKGVSTTKLIYRSGLLDRTLVYQNGQTLSTQNLLYDEVSGAQVVTATQNEHDHYYYTTKLPAYWFYAGMGAAYQNAGKVFSNVASVNTADFQGGDQLLLSGSKDPKAWIYADGSGNKSMIDTWGNAVALPVTGLKVIRSGDRNLQSLMAGQIVTLTNPVKNGKLYFDHVIDADAKTYSQYWQTYYGVHPPKLMDYCICPDGDFTIGIDTIVINRNTSINRFVARGGMSLTDLAYDPSDPQAFRYRKITNDGKSSCDIMIRLDKVIKPLRQSDIAFVIFSRIKADVSPGVCGNVRNGTGTYHIFSMVENIRHDIDSGTYALQNNCSQLTNCRLKTDTVADLASCKVGAGQVVNPYLVGVLGNWRQQANYKYLAERAQTGIFGSFELFQDAIPGASFFGTASLQTNWKAESTNLVYDPHGKLLESSNAISIPSGQEIGYGYNMVVAAAHNASYEEIAFDGFEDYHQLAQVGSSLSQCNLPEHFKFVPDGAGSGVTETDSHTGRCSMMVVHGSPASLTRPIVSAQGPRSALGNGHTFTLQQTDMIQTFAPLAGSFYVISLWLKETRDVSQLDLSSGTVRITFYDAANGAIGTALELRAKGVMVNDWQQLSETFKIPDNAASIKIELSSPVSMLVDDIRLQPFKSAMKGYVYDALTNKLSAELDDQNFVTYYEYDAEGQLERVKKETERGIVTIQEARAAKPKN